LKFAQGGWDIERDTIAKIEDGRRWVGDSELLELARALGRPLDVSGEGAGGG
jgi:DNA-binding XRE family transcriptional regulator